MPACSTYVDMTPQLLKSQQAGADVILAYGIGPELAQIANGSIVAVEEGLALGQRLILDEGLGHDHAVAVRAGDIDDYDSVYLLAAAIKQAGSTDGAKVRAALEDLNTKVEGVVLARGTRMRPQFEAFSLTRTTPAFLASSSLA
jgi:branched-chain amino acid transport system substrate-binding protein